MRVSIVIAFIGVTACQRADLSSPVGIREIASPAGPSSRAPNLTVGPGGETYLSWIELNDATPPALKLTAKTQDGWSEPRTITQSDDLVVNWADFPSLLDLGKGLLAAHWLSVVPDDEGYNVNVALSRDGGRTWDKPVVPHRDGTPTEHGFVSMVPAPGGGVAVFWLDSRKMKPTDDFDVSMMSTNINFDGTLGAESVIDVRVCECCQTSATSVPGGILAVYRDRSDTEIRDISIVRFAGDKWSQPRTVSADKWEIYGCPINGPAIAAKDHNVAVAWFTGAADKNRVNVAFSRDDGNTFGPPVQIDEGNPLGRVDVVMLDSGGAFVSWVEKTGKGAEVRARQIGTDGTRHPYLVVGATSASTSSGFPHMVRSDGALIFAWLDTDPQRVRTAVLSLKDES